MRKAARAAPIVQRTRWQKKEGDPKAAFFSNPESQLDSRSTGDETPHDCNDREHEKQVDQAAADVEDHEAEQPQNEENYRDRPQHCRAPRKGLGATLGRR
jgi:hypothetical protein